MSFQKISTVIQNILIKSISHSVNFTIPDLKPHTHTHRHASNLYTRPFRIRDLFDRFESFQQRKWRNASRKWATLETCTPPANSYVKFNDGNRTAAKNTTDTFDDDCNNCSNDCRNLYKTGSCQFGFNGHFDISLNLRYFRRF